MQNTHKKTIKKMVIANDNLRYKILDYSEIDEENNKIILEE